MKFRYCTEISYTSEFHSFQWTRRALLLPSVVMYVCRPSIGG